MEAAIILEMWFCVEIGRESSPAILNQFGEDSVGEDDVPSQRKWVCYVKSDIDNSCYHNRHQSDTKCSGNGNFCVVREPHIHTTIKPTIVINLINRKLPLQSSPYHMSTIQLPSGSHLHTIPGIAQDSHRTSPDQCHHQSASSHS